MRPVEIIWGGDGVPPERIWDQWKVLWEGDGYPPPPSGGQSENLTSRRTTYAGGNETVSIITAWNGDAFSYGRGCLCPYQGRKL